MRAGATRGGVVVPNRFMPKRFMNASRVATSPGAGSSVFP